MGWMSWERFRCITDCERYPKECISENLIMEMADIMADEGLVVICQDFFLFADREDFVLQCFSDISRQVTNTLTSTIAGQSWSEMRTEKSLPTKRDFHED
jgi:hypothetical protein